MEGGRVTRYLGDAVDGGGGGGRLFIAMFDDGCVGNECNEIGSLLVGWLMVLWNFVANWCGNGSVESVEISQWSRC